MNETRTPINSSSELAARFWENPRLPDCPIWDMHGHMGRWKGIYFPRGSTDDMIRTMDEANVEVLCFSHHAALSSQDIGNAPALEAARRYPGRLMVYLVMNPRYTENLHKVIESFEQHRHLCAGFKVHPAGHETKLSDESYRGLWQYADAHRVPVLSHTWGGSATCGEGEVRRVAERYPNAPLLMGHSLYGKWKEAAEMALEFPNLYLELTAVLGVNGALEILVEKAGSERILFGTDLPWFDPIHGVGALLSADITDNDRHNIMHRNAKRLLGRE